jgi:hypothetical protein
MIRLNLSAIAALALTAFAAGNAGANETTRTAAFAPAVTTAMVRVVHGSPDAGPVSVSVNGKTAITNFLYGTVTPYLSLPPGTYTLAVTTAGGATVKLTATIAAGKFYSIVATGELSPKAAPKTPNIALTPYADEPFTSSGGVNFHHGAPAVDATVPFGYGFLTDPTDHLLGSAKFATETGPIELKAPAQQQPIELYAVGVRAVTLIPNQVESKDFKNLLPFSGGANLSVFAIDGPGAATTPTVAGSDVVRLVGAFDAKGK